MMKKILIPFLTIIGILVFSQNRQFRRKRSRVKVDAHAIRRGLLLVIRTFDVFGDT